MNVYESIVLKDCWPYQDTEFKIPKGVSVIYGINKTNASSKNANGAGKSFLMSQVQEIQYQLPVIGARTDRVKKGVRALKLTTHDGIKTEIIHNNSKIEVLADGKSVARTNPLAKAWIAKHLPITPDEFNTYVHLDSRIGHPLVMGSGAERQRFFTSFFQLDRLDQERKLIASELRGLKSIKAAYAEVKREFLDLKSTLESKATRKELEAQLAKIEAKLEKYTALQEERVAYNQRTLFMSASKTQRQMLVKALGKNELTTEAFANLRKATRKRLEQLEEQLEQAEEYASHLRQVKRYEQQIKEIDPKQLRLLDKYELDQLKTFASKYRQAVEEIHSIERSKSRYISTKPKKVERTDDNLGNLLEQEQSLKHKLEHAKKFGSGICNSCGQTVKTVDKRKIEKALKELEVRISKCRAYQSYKAEHSAWAEDQEKIDALNKSLERNVTIRDKYKKFKSSYQELADMPTKPKKWAGPKIDVSEVKDKLKKLERLDEALAFLKPNLDLLLQGQDKEPKDYGDHIQDLNNKKAKITADLEVVTIYRSKLKPLKARLLELKSKLKDEEALKILNAAYGDKAAKRMVVESISSLLMAQVNKYARIVFPEHFQFELVWGTELSLLVHRKYGSRSQTSDVRKLSGAEYKLFTLVLVMALLTFVPARKRSSVLILDEPGASMHDETRESFTNFLGVMTKIIPSIVIITPKSDEVYAGAKAFTVVKSGGFSKIVKGHPSQIGD